MHLVFPLMWEDVCHAVSTPHSDKKRKLDVGSAATSNGGPSLGKLKKKDAQHGKFKKNKHGKFGKKP